MRTVLAGRNTDGVREYKDSPVPRRREHAWSINFGVHWQRRIEICDKTQFGWSPAASPNAWDREPRVPSPILILVTVQNGIAQNSRG